MAQNELLTQNITDWKDVGEIQNQANKAEFGNRMGLYTIEWNVAAEMNIQGVVALPVGTYYLKAPQIEENANIHTWDNFFIPAGTIIQSCVVHTHEAKAGAGTITPFIGAAGSVDFTPVTTAGAIDDLDAINAGGGATDPSLISVDSDIGIVVASNTVTAGGITIFLKYYIGNV
jgi:hypothetical protein